jgi:hypothetical protein
MPTPVMIGTNRFPSQARAVAEAQRVRNKYADGEAVRDEDVPFLTDLLYLHSEAADKIGAGIAGFSVGRDLVYGTTRCFFVHRVDGSRTDFSFKNCIEGAKPRQDRYNAIREAVSEQTVRFKQQTFAGRAHVPCAVRGTATPFADAHVDHVPPQTLRALATAWLAREGIAIDAVIISPPADNQFVADMIDPGQRQRWMAYHEHNARLRIVCREANLSDVPRAARADMRGSEGAHFRPSSS